MDLVKHHSVDWKGIQMKVSKSVTAWLCGLRMCLHTTSLSSVWTAFMFSMFGFHPVHFFYLQCTNCKCVFFLYTCVVRYTFSTNNSVRLFCFLIKHFYTMLFIMTIDRIRNTVIAGHCCEELVISWELFLCNRIRRLLL